MFLYHLCSNKPNLPLTLLNICAVLSKLGRHEEARGHAMNAVVLLQGALMNTFVPKINKKRRKIQEDDAEAIEKSFKEKI